jgi:hypothetical protein
MSLSTTKVECAIRDTAVPGLSSKTERDVEGRGRQWQKRLQVVNRRSGHEPIEIHSKRGFLAVFTDGGCE